MQRSTYRLLSDRVYENMAILCVNIDGMLLNLHVHTQPRINCAQSMSRITSEDLFLSDIRAHKVYEKFCVLRTL